MKVLIWLSFILLVQEGFAQKYEAKTCTITFNSDAPLEDIEAISKKGLSLFDISSNAFVFSVLIGSFQFEKSLMQEHFNEKYLESDKYPKATFQGKISGFSINNTLTQKVSGFSISSTLTQNVIVEGKITIHGITKEIKAQGTAIVVGGDIKMSSKFIVRLEDYKIKIPQLLWQNIAEEVEVNVDVTYKPVK